SRFHMARQHFRRPHGVQMARDLPTVIETTLRPLFPEFAAVPWYPTLVRSRWVQGLFTSRMYWRVRPQLQQRGRDRGPGLASLISPPSIAATLRHLPRSYRKRNFPAEVLAVAGHEILHAVIEGVALEPPLVPVPRDAEPVRDELKVTVE